MSEIESSELESIDLLENAEIIEKLNQTQYQLTFIKNDIPRRSHLALWDNKAAQPTGDLQLTPQKLEDISKKAKQNNQIFVARKNNDLIEIVTAPVQKLPFPKAIYLLLGVQIDDNDSDINTPSSSTKAWAIASRNVLNLISQAKFYPALTNSGIDAWKLGPLTEEYQIAQEHLTKALPAEAYTNITNIAEPIYTPSPGASLIAFSEAIADSYIRNVPTNEGKKLKAFASQEATIIDPKLAVKHFFEHTEDKRVHTLLKIESTDTTTSKHNLFKGRIILQAQNQPELQLPAYIFANYLPEFSTPRQKQIFATLKRVLQSASKIYPAFQKLNPAESREYITLSSDNLEQLYGEIRQRLGAVGLNLALPDQEFSELEIKPTIIQKGNLSSRLNLASLIELNWQGTVDGQQVSEEELNQLVESERNVIRLQGQWVRISSETRQQLKQTTISSAEAIAAALGSEISLNGEVYSFELSENLVKLRDTLQNFESNKDREKPVDLEAELRPYQQRGLSWLYQMDQLGLGGILADDMGLGKTLQMLALHLDRQEKSQAPTLVVCPASVIGNWEKEAKKFAPKTTIKRYHGVNRNLKDISSGEILLTTYGILRQDADKLTEIKWGLIVADEAHAMKNPYSRTAKAIRQIPSETKFALTGTPIQNKLVDLWSLLDWTTPGLLGPLANFRREIASPIEKIADEDTQQRLQNIVKPFVLRRQKSDPDIVPDLPPKMETNEYVPLTTEQAVLYKAVVAETMTQIEESSGISRKGLILSLLTKLKQVCNHPALVKATKTLQEDLVQQTSEDVNSEPDEPDYSADRSGKLLALAEILSTIKQTNESCLIFTQYVTMGKIIKENLESHGYKCGFLHGSLSINQRENLVEQFQAGTIDTFIISLKAGGLGLNLTQASHVIHYDRWWNPAVEDQASDRAWRIGQDKTVQIHRLICEGTIEEKIAALLEEKRALAGSVIDSGEAWVSELNDDELQELVSLSEDNWTV